MGQASSTCSVGKIRLFGHHGQVPASLTSPNFPFIEIQSFLISINHNIADTLTDTNFLDPRNHQLPRPTRPLHSDRYQFNITKQHSTKCSRDQSAPFRAESWPHQSGHWLLRCLDSSRPLQPPFPGVSITRRFLTVRFPPPNTSVADSSAISSHSLTWGFFRLLSPTKCWNTR